MTLSLRLDVRQSQGLVMTPQLQQAIKLLQLSNLELSAYVERELEQNPLLEAGQEGDDGAAAPATLGAEPETQLTGDMVMNGAEPGDGWSGGVDEGWTASTQDGLPQDVGINSLAPVGRGGSTDFSDDAPDLDARLSRDTTLREHLMAQLQVDIPAGPERLIAIHLVDQLDDAGYLRSGLEDVADRLDCKESEVEAVLKRVQQCDPPGVFARSLQECLALQLADAGRLDPAMQALLDHLELLAQADLQALIRICGVLPDDLPEMIAELKALHPKPGHLFAQEAPETLIPDVYVYCLPNGTWRVELNTATLPKVLINNDYHTELLASNQDEKARVYLAERMQSATWLVKALDQRARTVLRVAEAVVERQLPFLTHGVQHLRPLVLRDIAETIGLHESTVSRATADKYVATPRGNFPFRYFFSNALPGTDGGQGHSAEAIRQQIKVLIEREAPERILSDDQIVQHLKGEGIMIARRTVAKYRESLAIPSSAQRRRAKALRLA